MVSEVGGRSDGEVSKRLSTSVRFWSVFAAAHFSREDLFVRIFIRIAEEENGVGGGDFEGFSAEKFPRKFRRIVKISLLTTQHDSAFTPIAN